MGETRLNFSRAFGKYRLYDSRLATQLFRPDASNAISYQSTVPCFLTSPTTLGSRHGNRDILQRLAAESSTTISIEIETVDRILTTPSHAVVGSQTTIEWVIYESRKSNRAAQFVQPRLSAKDRVHVAAG